MRFDHPETISCDVLVVGAGGAGLRTAIAAAARGANVLVVSKTRTGRSTNTYMSKGVIAASGWGVPDDDAETHTRDTLKGGRFLNDPAIVARIAQRAKAEVAFLHDCGVPFAMANDQYKLLKLPGHQMARHVLVANWSGRDLILPLARRAAEMGVSFLEHVLVTRLLVSDNRVGGALGLSRDGNLFFLKTSAVVLATGGYGQIYRNTNNAPGITGDGQALAYEAGAALKDMEFVQFYPTARGRQGSRIFLYEQLLPQKGVSLRTAEGQDILERSGISDPMSLTRDRLSQLIMRALTEKTDADPSDNANQGIWMDLESLDEEKAHQLAPVLPRDYWQGQKRFEVVPTTHFCMGGVVTDDCAKTSIDGLYAVGEAAAGAHGANRLGGNALAEIFSMGSLAGENAAGQAVQMAPPAQTKEAIEAEIKRLHNLFRPQGERPEHLVEKLKALMWFKVGILRDKESLETALAGICANRPPAAISNPRDLALYLEFENMCLVAEMVSRAALERTESRGSHFRCDFPTEDDSNWMKNIVIRKKSAAMQLSVVSVPQESVAGLGQH